MCVVFFFKPKTAYEMRISDWSSDVCSSDLLAAPEMHRLDPWGVDRDLDHRPRQRQIVDHPGVQLERQIGLGLALRRALEIVGPEGRFDDVERSEERRVGKECVSKCRSRWPTYH